MKIIKHKRITCWSGCNDDSPEDSSLCYPSVVGRQRNGEYWSSEQLRSSWKAVTCKKCLRKKLNSTKIT